MPEVQIKKGEPVDRALKRLKNKLDSEGILEEIRRLRSFETPTQRTKRKARAAAKRRGRHKFRFTLDRGEPRDKGEAKESKESKEASEQPKESAE